MHKKVILNLFSILFVFLSSCTVPLPSGEISTREMTINGEEFMFEAKEVRGFKADIIGIPHAPVFFPILGFTKGYTITLIRKNQGELIVSGGGFDETSIKEQLDYSLENLNLTMSPDKHILAFWREEDFFSENKTILYMLDKGAPFYIHTEQIFSRKEKVNWADLPKIEAAIKTVINDCNNYYNQAGFWDALDKLEDKKFIDDLLLESWPKCFAINESTEKAINPTSKSSKEWREKALSKAEKIFFLKESNHKLDAMNLIVASENRFSIDKADEFIVEAWPSKLGHDYVKTRLLIDKKAKLMSDENKKVITNKLNELSKKDNLFYENFTYLTMAKHLDDELLGKFRSYQLERWPEDYNFELYHNFDKFNEEFQLKVLEVAENNIHSTNTKHKENARKMIEKNMECESLEELQKSYPELELRFECASVSFLSKGIDIINYLFGDSTKQE